MNFILVAVLAYILNGGVILVDKILLKTSVPNASVYTFYINALGLISLLLLPFGVNFNLQIIIPGAVSGVAFAFATLTFFQSLKSGEASVCAPVVGALNPFFGFILGSLFLNQVLNPQEITGFFVILAGTGILTFNLWFSKLGLNKQAFLMVLSGLLYAISFLFLKEVFSGSNFVTGLVFTRTAAAATVFCFLLSKKLRGQIFDSQTFKFKSTSSLLLFGQSMGAGSGLLLVYATSLASPALVNSLFGMQYIVILGAALILGKNHPNLLDEKLTKSVIFQKILGAGILSFGVYLLSKP